MRAAETPPRRPEQPAPPTIRRLTLDDDPRRVRDLRLEMLADTPIAFIERLEDTRRRPAEHWTAMLRRHAGEPARVTFVAEVAGRWVGQAGGHLDHGHQPPVAYLVAVYVAPAYRGTGLVERLVAKVATWARARDFPELLLEVALENPRAVAAYRRMGFTPTGRSQPHPLFPETATEIEMSCPIGD